jgi:acetyltransferase-like isoleucine patch superfamily enzyme
MSGKKYDFVSGDRETILNNLIDILGLKKNPFHPLVFINGPECAEIAEDVYIGYLSEINARGSKVIIKKGCDIASFVDINVADSHKMSIGISDKIERGPITLDENVFVGSHSFIGGGTHIGHHSVVAAGTILVKGGEIPPYSLIKGNPAVVYPGYYRKDDTAQ